MERRSTFEHQRPDFARREPLQRRAKRPVPCDLDLSPCILERFAQFGAARRLGGRDDDDRRGDACRVETRRRRRPEAAVEDHAREWMLAIDAANGQLGIVNQHGAAADADRVDLRATAMHMTVCRRRAELRPASRRFRDAAVQTRCRFEDDERPVMMHQREKRLIERDRSLGAQSDVDAHVVRAQKREACAADERIGIFDRGHDARDAGVDDACDARTRPALMAAGLERAVQRRTARADARFGERSNFRVRLAGALVIARADDHVVSRHDDGADHRIRARAAAAARRMKQRALHVRLIDQLFLHWRRGPTPRRELSQTPRLGFPRPRLGVAAGATIFLRTSRRRIRSRRTGRGRRGLRRRRRTESAA